MTLVAWHITEIAVLVVIISVHFTAAHSAIVLLIWKLIPIDVFKLRELRKQRRWNVVPLRIVGIHHLLVAWHEIDIHTGVLYLILRLFVQDLLLPFYVLLIQEWLNAYSASFRSEMPAEWVSTCEASPTSPRRAGRRV